MITWFIIFIIFLAFAFDFINGFHDAANSIATMVATKIIKPFYAVLWAAFFNFIAFLFFHLNVATTVGENIINPSVVDPHLIFSVLLAAILWNLLTWYFGLPSSSSHALIGGLIGAGLAKNGVYALKLIGIFKVLIAIMLSPLFGLLLAGALMLLLKKLTRRWKSKFVLSLFSKLQFISAAFLSLTHGANDAQKTMGIIAVLLFSAGLLNGHFYVPFWVVVSCNLVMALGTLAGGWRIVHTLGEKIAHLNPVSGSCAETGGAITILLATHLGIPISTTHTVTGAILGVGVVEQLAKNYNQVLKQIILAWIFTLPITAIIAAILVKI